MLYLAANTDAVDAALFKKDLAVREFSTRCGVPLPRIACIGDSVADLPFLTIESLGLRAAPANAQSVVKQAVSSLPNSFPLEEECLDAFLVFYEAAARQGIEHIFTDKDGVLTWGPTREREFGALRAIFHAMGDGNRPTVSILTGSSIDQNVEFLDRLGIATRSPGKEPGCGAAYVLLAENGAVWLNSSTGEISFVRALDPAFLKILHGPFQNDLLSLVAARVLPRFGFGWANNRDDQHERVYLPPKTTMVTVNVPRSTRAHQDYRRAQESNEFRAAVLSAMVETARQHGIDSSPIEAVTTADTSRM